MRPPVLLLLLAILCVPSAAAQPQPRIVLDLSKPPAFAYVDENGRAEIALPANATGRDFWCTSAYDVRLELQFAQAFPKWAGASLKENRHRFLFPPPGPGLSPQKTSSTVSLVVSWDMEEAPVDATASYGVSAVVPAAVSGSCAPTPVLVHLGPQLPAILVCRSPDNGGPGPGCRASVATNATTPVETASAPALSMVLALGGLSLLVAAAFARRR